MNIQFLIFLTILVHFTSSSMIKVSVGITYETRHILIIKSTYLECSQGRDYERDLREKGSVYIRNGIVSQESKWS